MKLFKLYVLTNFYMHFFKYIHFIILIWIQAKPEVTPAVIQHVVKIVTKAQDCSTLELEITTLLEFVESLFEAQNVEQLRMQWDQVKEEKIKTAIDCAMREFDCKHYPETLKYQWEWHPFYKCFIENDFCADLLPEFPLKHNEEEATQMHYNLTTHSPVPSIYPVPWSVLLIGCFF